MNTSSYRTARALYPHRRDVWEREEEVFIYEPLPPAPVDHPELALFPGDPVEGLTGREGVGPGPGEGGNVLTKSVESGSGPPGRLDEPMPARMLNEFVYCPRLFYYEYVDGVFLENEDTERGSAIHKKVDRGRGSLAPAGRRTAAAVEDEMMPPAAEGAVTGDAEAVEHGATAALPGEVAEGRAAAVEADGTQRGAALLPDVIHSRSATLGSERLGVLAKMDLIEVELAGEPPPALTRVRARRAKGTAGGGGEGDLFSSGGGEAEAAQEVRTRVSAVVPGEVAGIVEVVAPGPRAIRRVTPVDYKKGAPRAREEGNDLWDADKMQLGLQILILRDNGYVCDEGVIFYRATKQRVPLVMTGELEGWILEKIAEARMTARGTIPPPLVNSPKCVRCSLAPVCLPDETRMLARGGAGLAAAGGADDVTRGAMTDGVAVDGDVVRPRGGGQAPRRLIAARDEARALYLNTQGVRVTLRGEVLVVKEEERVQGEFRTQDVSHVALMGNIQMTTQAVRWLCEAEIPLAYFSMSGWFYGLTRGHGLKNVFTRVEQFEAAKDPRRCLALAQRFVHGKIRNHRTQLMRNHVNLPEGVSLKMKRAAGDVLMARSLEELLGMEGAAAAMYFQNFAGMIKVGADDDELPGLERPCRPAEPEFKFDFTKRKRRPPTDPVNALLSLAYSLLAKDCTLAALAVGFDPYVGFYHQPRFGRPALALDLMEEFRPLVAESAVLTALNNRMVTPGHFVRAGEAVNLTPHGRRAFFQAYEQRMNGLITHPVFDYKVSYRRVLELQARMLARYLTGEIPEYVPMMTR